MNETAKSPTFSADGITAPLRHGTFRRIWLASLLSNLGILIQGVGAAWAMTQMTAAADKVARLNPHVTFQPIARRIDATNAEQFFRDLKPDVVLDGCDNFATRLAVADAALALDIPLVSAAAAEFSGQLAVYRGWEADKPCYRCFVGHDPDRPEATCSEQGVLGALTGVIGSLAALEAVRAVAPFGDDPAGKLLLFDALSLRFRTLALPKDPGCTMCW